MIVRRAQMVSEDTHELQLLERQLDKEHRLMWLQNSTIKLTVS